MSPALSKYRLFYHPYWIYVITDVVMLAVSFVVILLFFPLTTQIPFQKYDIFVCVFAGIWLIMSYFLHRYVRIKYMRVGAALRRLFATAVFVFAFMQCYMSLLARGSHYSTWVLLTIWLVMCMLSVCDTLLSYAYRYALNAEPEIERAPDRGPQSVLYPPKKYTEEEVQRYRTMIAEQTSPKVLKYLEKHVVVASSNTYTICSAERYNFQKLRSFRFDTIINFMPLNQVRGINKMFGIINDQLPDNGYFVCCFEPQSYVKGKIFRKYPPIISHIIYSGFFLYKRVMPKVVVTSRLYYDITAGKNRVLSKAEVLGRLCYCGFEIVDEHKMDNLIYVVARRSFRPQTIQRRVYGLFVKLNRVGKNGKMFKVLKLRTMHPYSEYLQQYMYDHYSLQEGGKFNHDIRVTSNGRICRKCFIDELPMLINLAKGDMKLVGVRPISKQYYSLYSQELQEKRTHHTPGLLPPFYADMPKTLDEIQASEMKYLTMCEKKGTLITDFIYFWKIFYTIIFKHARSH